MTEIGLGEAIAGGTNLSGEFGSPFTRALATKEQNELRRLQMEEARAAKERAAAERVGRYLYKDDGKWFNPKNAEEFRKEYSMALPKMIAAERSRDIAGLTELQMNVQNKATYYKAKDEQERELQTFMPKFETARITDKILKYRGIQGIEEDAMLYPVPAAVIDESGIVRVNKLPTLDISKSVSRYAKDIAESAKLRKVSGPSGLDVYETDMNDPVIKKAKQDMISAYMDSPDNMERIMVSSDFRKFFDDYTKDKDRQSYLGDNLDDVQRAYLEKKFDVNFKPRAKELRKLSGRSGGSRSGGGGSYNSIWNFNDDKEGYTLIQSRSTSRPVLDFPIKSKNNQEELVTVYSPKAKYDVSKGVFLVKGFDGATYGSPITIEVTPEMIRNQFDMTEQELAKEFPSYRPKAAEPKPKRKKLY